MTLASAVKGKVSKPHRILMYGVEGVGKSTFAASAPAPIFLGAEDGTSELDVTRFPQPGNWLEALDAVAELTTADHSFKSLVVDTLDWLEPLCWQHVCATKRDKNGELHENIEWYPYGAGFVAALEEWRVFLARLERLRAARGMHVIMLAHSWIKSFKNPEGDDFDRYELKLNNKASGLLKEWADAVLFARYETFANKDGKTKRVRGVSTGARVVQTRHAAAWDAKNRYNLPETIPLNWQDFIDAVAADRPVDPEVVRKRLDELLAAADPELRAKGEKAAAAHANDPAALARLADQLASKINLKSQESAS
jgi:hypothetical protein